MASPSTKEDMVTTTGNSDDVRMVPNPESTKLISIALLLVGSVLAANILFQEPLALSWQGSFWGMLAALSFSTFVFLSGSIEKETPPSYFKKRTSFHGRRIDRIYRISANVVV